MEKTKFTKKKKVIISLGLAGILAVGGGITVAVQASDTTSESDMVYKETEVAQGNIIVGVTESGSVSIGNVTQDFDLDTTSSTTTSTTSTAQVSGNTTAGNTTDSSTTTSASSSATTTQTLEVEEVYVTAGTVVNQGDAILKITDDSMNDYRKELEDALSDAKLALSEANLSAATTNLDADYNYDSNIANGTVAQSVYDATIAQLENAVTSAQQALDSSATKIAAYQTRIAAGEDCTAALTEEQVNYSTLQAKLTSAQNQLTTGTIEAKQTYEESMLNYNNASSLKSIDAADASQSISDAKEDVADAEEALSDFEDFIGDGVVYSEYSGTIISLGYEAGDTLSSSTSIATFSDTTAVTMSVSVSEEDITAVAVGDTVNIALNAYEDEAFTGQVTSIDTSASSGSSTVDYTVTVAFAGDVSKIYADMTGDVTFVTKEVDDVIYVSDKAVIQDGTKSYVDIKEDNGSITRVEVTCGFSNGENVEIQSGLEAGQTALIESQVSAQ